jgi:hypothetical protein
LQGWDTRISPISGAINFPTWGTTRVDNNSNDYENTNGSYFNARKDILSLTIAEYTEHIDTENEDIEYSDPDGESNLVVRYPVTHNEGTTKQFKWKYNKPTKSIIPRHCKTPCRINKAR